ncbi:hypothetical protein [Anaerotruncus massiliensis (ex Liu et al. 2021)]|uniref:phage major capsid protein n=1 Tax=Anaerotruncus massiliensis (ex Liu et al. 2021) TaxID=2321404 RepID=UPI003AF7A918
MAGITFSMASGLNDSIFGKSAEPIMMFIEKRAEAFEKASIIPKIFKESPSKNFAEKITSLTSMDGFTPVGEGGAYPKDEMQEGYDKILEHVVWKNQFVVTREMIDDAKLLSLKKKPQGFVTSYYRTREQFAAALLAGGIGKSVSFKGREFPTTGADGKPLFDAQHPPKVKGAKQANKFTDAFTGDALSKMETAMQNVRDDNDNVLAVAPNTIVIPNLWELKKQVFETIGADKDPATANNGFNYQFGRWNVIVWAYLNQYITKDAAPWILMDSGYNEENGGALWLNRVPLEVRSWVDNNNDNNVWNGYARFIAGFADWRFAAIGGVADGVALPG